MVALKINSHIETNTIGDWYQQHQSSLKSYRVSRSEVGFRFPSDQLVANDFRQTLKRSSNLSHRNTEKYRGFHFGLTSLFFCRKHGNCCFTTTTTKKKVRVPRGTENDWQRACWSPRSRWGEQTAACRVGVARVADSTIAVDESTAGDRPLHGPSNERPPFFKNKKKQKKNEVDRKQPGRNWNRNRPRSIEPKEENGCNPLLIRCASKLEWIRSWSHYLDLSL